MKAFPKLFLLLLTIFRNDKSLFQVQTLFLFVRFKLTTTRFTVIVNRTAQGSICQVYACLQTQRHNQLPRWDSTPSSRERNRRAFATIMASLLTHKGTVFHLVQLVVIRRRAATQWNSHTNQFQWPHQVSLQFHPTIRARVFVIESRSREMTQNTSITSNHKFN